MKKLGQVIFWNRVYGFIQVEDTNETIFFHKTNREEDYKKTNLFDKVSFFIGFTTEGKHKGRLNAKTVGFLTRGSSDTYIKTVGILKTWNGIIGFLVSPQLKSQVLLHKLRFLNLNTEVKIGEAIVFAPIKNIRNTSELFACFAYPLSTEQNLKFLLKQAQENKLEEVIFQIENLGKDLNKKSINLIFELKLELLIQNKDFGVYYSSVEEHIKHYKNKYSFEPNLDLLDKYLSKAIQKELWYNGIISSCDINYIYTIFKKSSRDDKQSLLKRLKENEKKILLDKYFDRFFSNKKLALSRSNLAFLKDFSEKKYSNEVEQVFYKKVKQYFLDKLSYKNNLLLYISYVHDYLPESYIRKNINNLPVSYFITNHKIPRQRQLLAIYVETLFTSFMANRKEETFFELVICLVIIEETANRKDENQEIKNILIRNTLIRNIDENQNFILWLFKLNEDFNAKLFFETHKNNINLFFKIWFLIKEETTKLTEYFPDLENELQNFIKSNPWNLIIRPINSEKDNIRQSLIKLLETLKQRTDFSVEINLEEIANLIFNHIPAYQIEHLRLWLYDYVAPDKFDYTGFKIPFKYLNKEEKKKFKQKGKQYKQEDIEQQNLEELEPCMNYEIEEEGVLLYTANLKNIYFSNGYIVLRLHDGTSSERNKIREVVVGMNALAYNDKSKNIEIKIKCNGKKIIDVNLEPLFSIFRIIVDEGKTSNSESEELKENPTRENTIRENTITYIEDWELKEKILLFLNKNHINIHEVIKLERSNEIDFIFTIETNDDCYAMIWENNNQTQDRASLVFKSSKEDYDKQINIIKELIKQYSNIKNNLRLKQNEETRKKLGWVGRILKKRGAENAFDLWKAKLDKALNSKAVSTLNWEEAQKLITSLTNTLKPRKMPSVKVIDDLDLPTGELLEQVQKPVPSKNWDKQILQALKKLNTLLEQQLNQQNHARKSS